MIALACIGPIYVGTGVSGDEPGRNLVEGQATERRRAETHEIQARTGGGGLVQSSGPNLNVPGHVNPARIWG